jgi:hypothetical protein
MNAAAALQNGEIVRATLARHELVPTLARVTEVRVRIHKTGHHDAPLRVDLDSIGSPLKVLPHLAATSGDDDPIARREPTAIDRTHISRGRPHSRPLFTQRRKREKSSASYDEIRFHD